jgi:hypothetical protein
MRHLVVLGPLFALLVVGCGQFDPLAGLADFEAQVGERQLGRSKDQWIEIRNSAGEWERTGLIFGYVDDNEECEKAIAGLREVNFAREYRCTSAQP